MNKKNVFFAILFAVLGLVSSCTSKGAKDTNKATELYRINVGGKYGFINENGDIMIEPQFDNAYFHFKANDVCFAISGERKGLINMNGEFVVELNKDIDKVWEFENGVACCIGKNNKYGLVAENGSMVLPLVYSDINRDGPVGFTVQDTLGNMGYVNNRGEFIVPCVYDDVNGFNEGMMVVATSKKCGYVDTLGNWVIDSIYDDARAFGDGLARVKKGNQWMIIDRKGEIIELKKNDEILTGFEDNRAFIMRNGSICMINRQGMVIKQIEADSVYGFHESYSTFKKNSKYGMLDTNGNVFIEAKYDELHHYTEGFAAFKKNNLWGIIEASGNVLIAATHNISSGKFEGYSLLGGVDSMDIITYYDQNGNVIWKDMPGNSFSWPAVPTKEDYIAYYDTKLSELDPIEGIYYVTFNQMAVDRENDHASSNGSNSNFFAVIRGKENKDEFYAYVIDKEKPYAYWVKKFVQIGESNTYAIVNSDETRNSNWTEDGKLILEDPNHFEVTLRTGGNNYYNWYVQCEFTKDYPSSAIYEQVQQAEWTGSGFAIADGFIATNYHVTNGAKTINIRGVNGDMDESYKGFVVASDREHDLAIIKIVDKDFKGFDAIPYCIGKSVPEVGDDIFVLGYPKTNTMGQEVKLTDGLISAASGFKGDESMYQISAPVQPGNSGGPLFDGDGNVIGIICAKHADAENANYAIKVSYLFNLVNSSGIEIKMPDKNNVSSKSLSKKVKQVKPYVYLIECRSH